MHKLNADLNFFAFIVDLIYSTNYNHMSHLVYLSFKKS